MMNLFTKNRNSKKGSIALISLVIISAITLLLVLGMSDTNISTAYQHVNTQANKVAYYAAEACAEEAMLRLEADETFTGTTLMIDADTTCQITASPTLVTITVNFLDYTQNFRATVNITQNGEANNIDLQQWEKY
jgi:hypothetical protein